MNLARRKQTRLKNFDYSQNAAYFITICAYNRARLFAETAGVSEAIIVKWLSEIESKYANAMIDKYVIMPNHIHFIIFNPGTYDENQRAHTGAVLHEIIKWFKTQTTNEYISSVKRGLLQPFEKRVWQRGYYEHVIRNESDYAETCRYIDENQFNRENESD